MLLESSIDISRDWFLGNNRQRNLRIVQCSWNAPLFLTTDFKYAQDYADYGVWKVTLKYEAQSNILDFSNYNDVKLLKWPRQLIELIQSGKSDLNTISVDIFNNKYILIKKFFDNRYSKTKFPTKTKTSSWENYDDYKYLLMMWADIYKLGFDGFTHYEFGYQILALFSIKNIDKISANRIDLLLENAKTYINKHSNEVDVNKIVDDFQKIKQKLKSPYNDIDWWMRKPYSDFKKFVLDFDNRNKRSRRDNDSRRIAMQNGAMELGEKDGYEIWYVPTWEAAKELGRNYKGRSSHWCISSDDPDYWFENHYDDEFVFLIRQNMLGDENDKIAIQFENGANSFNVDNITTWNIDNEDEQTFFSDELVHFAWDLLKKSGYKRVKYYENDAK